MGSSSATLMILGEDLEPDAVSAALGLSPDQSWRRGERKRAGDLVFDSVHEWGGWKRFASPSTREARLNEQVEEWLELLERLGPALRDLAARGWVAELSCFVAESQDLGLDPAQLEVLAQAQVRLEVRFSAD